MARAEKLDLEIVTPERLVLSETVDEAILPGSEGSFGVLPGHAPFLTALGVGEAAYRIGAHWHYLAVAGGFVEVLRDRVSVLAEICERAEEIDEQRAREKRKEAEAVLSRGRIGDQEFRKAEASLRKALTRLRVAAQLRS